MTTRLHGHLQAALVTTFKPVGVNLLQRQCACGGTRGPTGECDACRKKRLQRKIDNRGENDSGVPPIVHEVLRSPGQPLDAQTRTFMDARYGHKFSRVSVLAGLPPKTRLQIGASDDRYEHEAELIERQSPDSVSSGGTQQWDSSQVRIHIDEKAAASAHAIGARAYTVGRDIFFGAGQYSPGSVDGQKLLAHEIAHAAQQSRSDRGSGYCQRQLIKGTHTPSAPSRRPATGAMVMGFNVTKAMCQCKEGDLIDRQIAKDERAIKAYKECAKGANSIQSLHACAVQKIFGLGVKRASELPPAGQADPETSIITTADEAAVKKRAQLLNLPETGPCAELLRAANLAHERRHVEQYEEIAAEQGAAFAAEFNKLVWDPKRIDKLRAKFPKETAQYLKKASDDIQETSRKEVEAYEREQQFFTQAKTALEEICRVPQPTVPPP